MHYLVCNHQYYWVLVSFFVCWVVFSVLLVCPADEGRRQGRAGLWYEPQPFHRGARADQRADSEDYKGIARCSGQGRLKAHGEGTNTIIRVVGWTGGAEGAHSIWACA